MKKLFLSLILGSIIAFSIIISAQQQDIRRGGGSSGGLSGTLIVSGTNTSGMVLTAADNKGTNGVWRVPIWLTNSIADAEGGTVAIYELNDAFTSGFVRYAVNSLTNFWNGPSLNVSIGDRTPNPGDLATNNASIFNFGVEAGEDMIAAKCYALFNYGDASGQSMFATNSEDIFNFGDAAGGFAIFDNSFSIVNIGILVGLFQNYTNCRNIFAYGANSMNQGALSNSRDVYTFGTDINTSFFGELTNVFALGNQINATNSNDFIVGNSDNNLSFNGSSAHFSPPISAGTTNQWKTGGYVSDGKVGIAVNSTNYNLLTDLAFPDRSQYIPPVGGDSPVTYTNIVITNMLVSVTNDLWTVPAGKIAYVGGGLVFNSTNGSSITPVFFVKTNGQYYLLGSTTTSTSTNTTVQLQSYAADWLVENETLACTNNRTGLSIYFVAKMFDINQTKIKVCRAVSITNTAVTLYTVPANKLGVALPLGSGMAPFISGLVRVATDPAVSTLYKLYIVPSGGSVNDSTLTKSLSVAAGVGSFSNVPLLDSGSSIVVLGNQTTSGQSAMTVIYEQDK